MIVHPYNIAYIPEGMEKSKKDKKKYSGYLDT